MKRQRLSPILVASLVILFSAFVGEPALSGRPEGPPPAMAQDAAVKKSHGLLLLPVVYYTPETHLAFGVGGMYYFQLPQDKSANRPSNINGLITYTLKKQFSLDLNPDFYFGRGYHVQAYLTYSDFPDNFYGIGNATSTEMEEKFTSRYWKLSVEALKRVYRVLNVGFQYFFDNTTVIKVEDGGQLSSGMVPGSRGGRVSGLGYFMTWDSRNNIFFATKGSYHQFSAAAFGKGLGSDFAFNRFYFDLRRYFPFSETRSLGLHARMLFQTGNPPFWRMGLLGGKEIMRGYYSGRFRDKNMICWQAEYRWVPVAWRLGVIGFVGFGDVADKLGNFKLDNFKHTYGLGLRYIFNKEQGINIRLDFGFGKGTSGFYFTAAEAF
jgi:outer membrane protein assembly factor BamA